MNRMYLRGKLLCEKLNVGMYERIAIQNKLNGQIFGLRSEYFITPLGVACRCQDGEGLFDVHRSKELYEGNSIIYKRYCDEYISPKKVRYNKKWTEELALMAGIAVRTKDFGTVGMAEVPAVRFKMHQHK